MMSGFYSWFYGLDLGDEVEPTPHRSIVTCKDCGSQQSHYRCVHCRKPLCSSHAHIVPGEIFTTFSMANHECGSCRTASQTKPS